MNKEEFKTTTGLSKYCKECLTNDVFPDMVTLAKKYWKAAKDVDEFKKLVVNDDVMLQTQGGAQLSKETYGHVTRLMEMLDRICLQHVSTMADAGSVLIGDGKFSVNIDNGFGDCRTEVYVIKKTNCINAMTNFKNVCNGEFVVYDYDCGTDNDTVLSLKGRYGIYSYEGVVIFEEW